MKQIVMIVGNTIIVPCTQLSICTIYIFKFLVFTGAAKLSKSSFVFHFFHIETYCSQYSEYTYSVIHTTVLMHKAFFMYNEFEAQQ